MNRWQLTQELFEEVVALEPLARASHLRERAQGDEELVRRVEALVAADETPLDALERRATDILAELATEPAADPIAQIGAEELCGTHTGPYRIDEHVSTGGMGHVYRATRTSAGTERRVALKVLRPGLDTEAFLERFQRERRTLATLEHEHVVAFLDAGALDEGRPYLVMEYVDGVPVTVWARSQDRTQRLELFLQVLAAVGYAHGKLIVHRDLKPSNVLVTPQGIPKLLDFGVAAVLDTDEQPLDAHEPLTPAYACPEELRGEPASTASDVYSLGVLLREMLAEDLDRDLRAICATACAPDPKLRYASVESLAEDLRRYLAFVPLGARPIPPLRRTWLALRRNASAAVLAASVLLALAAGWVSADLGRRDARSEASLGWGAHAQARRTAHVFETWIAAVSARDPALAADATEHLEGAVRSDLADCPETEALVRMALADLYLQRGDHQRARPHAERAEELARNTRGLSEREQRRAAELLARLQPGG